VSAQEWKPIDTAPKDGTWVLGINNRRNCAVIIWKDDAVGMGGRRGAGWIHPFSTGELSTFWNGGCGSVATHWMPLPPPPES
jgi:hypothetical protein